MKYNRFIIKVKQEKGQPYKIFQRSVQHRNRWFGIYPNMRKRWIRKEQSDGIAKRACLYAKAERQHQGGSRGISRVRCVFTTLIHRNTKEKPHVFVRFFWWEEVDSNHRRRCQQIYSLLPLATRESSHMELVVGVEPTTC